MIYSDQRICFCERVDHMILNLRDLYEAASADGVPLRKGCLIRSAALHSAAPEELAGISAVIDLRTGLETERMPDRIPAGVTYHHIPFFDEAAAGITREKRPSEVPDMRRLYRDMLEKVWFRSNVLEVLNVIAAHDYSEGGILWHCTAGKDRCGVVSALVLLTLGVSRETIMKDYLRSNEICEEEGNMIYRKLLSEGKPEALAQAVREAFLAKPEYMQAALDAYDRDPLAFPDAERFRAAVLEG